jgi:hypothetical protein
LGLNVRVTVETAFFEEIVNPTPVSVSLRIEGNPAVEGSDRRFRMEATS